MKTPNGALDRWLDQTGANVRSSVLAHDLVVEGDVTSSGPVDIQGYVVVAGSGRIEGSIVAHSLKVLGTASGTILARNVRLAPSAVVHADISHERIAVEAGAELEGSLQSRA